MLTKEEMEFVVGYLERLKCGEVMERETVIKFVELVDRAMWNAVNQAQNTLAKNKELFYAYNKISRKCIKLKDENTALAAMLYNTMESYLPRGHA